MNTISSPLAQVETFEELAITSSLVRPAGASYCLQFIDRHRKMKMGVRDWEFLHPSLEPILSETHDVCAFQEDVTKICHHVAGLSFKQADKIRKMMNSLHEGSVEDRLWIETEREFLAGCIKNSGLTVEQARELWMRVSSFTGFSFCKSHSASYAQLSFKCTYLKAHYPAQFLAAVISNNHGFYSKDAYINEARRWGIRILPLDINKSGIKYVGKHNWMRPGIMHVRNLTDKTSSRIVEEKGIREFANVEDFISRVGAYRHEVENLVLAGAFDGFGLNQPELLYVIDGIYGRHRSLAENGLQFDVFGTRDRHPNHSDYSLTEKCLNELHILGFMLSGNILDILDLHPKSKGTVPAGEIANFVGKGIKVFGWPVTERVHTVSTTGKTMMFLTLEDQTGSMDVIFWPRNYGRFADVLAKPGPYEVWGKVTEEWDTHCLEAVNIRSAEWSPSQIDFELASQRLTRSAGYVYTDLPGIVAA